MKNTLKTIKNLFLPVVAKRAVPKLSKSDLQLKFVIDEISPKFNELKKSLDKYPNAFTLKYSDELKHFIEIDFDYLEPL